MFTHTHLHNIKYLTGKVCSENQKNGYFFDTCRNDFGIILFSSSYKERAEKKVGVVKSYSTPCTKLVYIRQNILQVHLDTQWTTLLWWRFKRIFPRLTCTILEENIYKPTVNLCSKTFFFSMHSSTLQCHLKEGDLKRIWRIFKYGSCMHSNGSSKYTRVCIFLCNRACAFSYTVCWLTCVKLTVFPSQSSSFLVSKKDFIVYAKFDMSAVDSLNLLVSHRVRSGKQMQVGEV